MASTPLYDSIAQSLRERIVSGSVSAGSCLGTEAEFAKSQGVSLGTVRKALDALVGEGLVYKRQGKGIFVSPTASVHRRVLGICGLDVFSGDVSPTYIESMRLADAFCQSHGLELRPSFVGPAPAAAGDRHFRPADQRPFTGALFLGCTPGHPLVGHAERLGIKHVVVTAAMLPGPGRVVIDVRHGVELALREMAARGSRQVVLVGGPQPGHWIDPVIRAVAEPTGMQVRCASLAAASPWMSVMETRGYQLVTDLLDGRLPDQAAMPAAEAIDGFVFVDDITARGGTRAILEHRDRLPEQLRVAVLGVCQTLVPLGLPVIHVARNIEEEMRQAVGLLMDQLEGRRSEPDCVVAGYAVLSDPQAHQWLHHERSREGNKEPALAGSRD